MTQVLDDIDRAIKDIAEGRPVVVVDDANRENEGDIILAASLATPELLAFMIRYTSGVICVPLPGAELDRLQLPLMTSQNTERMRTAFTLSVDARDGVTTGISAADRAATIARLVDPATTAQDLVRPGHIFPLRYAEGGVLRRPGHTEAAVDLARLAGLPPAGVLAEVVNDDGTMARLPELREFADTHGLALISIEQLIEYRRRTERQLTRQAHTKLPNAYGLWQAFGYRHDIDGTEYLALVLGDVADGTDVLTRLHSECLTGDVFGSLRCDCGAQLEAAMAGDRRRRPRRRALPARARGPRYRAAEQAAGLRTAGRRRGHGGRQPELGLPADAREYSAGAQMLADLGVRSVRLLTNNPAKVSGLVTGGVDVTARVPAGDRRQPLTTCGTWPPSGTSSDTRSPISASQIRCAKQWKRAWGGGLGERRRPAGRRHHRRGRAQPGHRGHPMARARSPTRWWTGRSPPPWRAASLTRWWSGCPAPSNCRSWPPSWPQPRRGGLPGRGDPRRHPALRVRVRRGDRRPDPGRARRRDPGWQRRAHL